MAQLSAAPAGALKTCPPTAPRRKIACSAAVANSPARRIAVSARPADRREESSRRRQGGKNAFHCGTFRCGGATERLLVQPGDRRSRPDPSDECVSHCPSASLANLPGWPSSRTASNGAAGRQIEDEAPGVADFEHCSSWRLKSALAALAPILPGTSIGGRPTPQAAATSRRIAGRRAMPCRNRAARCPSCRGSTGRLRSPAAG